VTVDDLDARSRVLVSAVALGIGRAALGASLDVFKAGSDRPSGLADERPHWLLADAATEMDAARLLVWRGAQTLDGNPASTPDVALAHTLAVGAAERTVAAALRIGGPDRYTRDGLLDRLSRDVRTVAFLGGTEEEHRLLAGQIFPQ
jgi:alkylation response protein AidB-like acyl-CoA dehydrogenase